LDEVALIGALRRAATQHRVQVVAGCDGVCAKLLLQSHTVDTMAVAALAACVQALHKGLDAGPIGLQVTDADPGLRSAGQLQNKGFACWGVAHDMLVLCQAFTFIIHSDL
jgi:hypothetical protein